MWELLVCKLYICWKNVFYSPIKGTGWAGLAKMDPIIGEFTITSERDPAAFHTSFARAINLDEGYELALKSIYHGPVNNLVFPTFALRTEETYGKPLQTYETLSLNTERFYEAPSDVLLEMHKLLTAKLELHEMPTLFEKNGYMTLTMQRGTWLKVNERMFLNSVFKYTTYQSRKKRETKPYELNEYNFKKMWETVKHVKYRYLHRNKNKLKEEEEEEEEKKKMEALINGLETSIESLKDKDEEVSKKLTPEGFKSQLEATDIPNDITELTQKLFILSQKFDDQTFEADIEEVNRLIESIKEKYDDVDSKVERNTSAITRLDRSLTDGMKTIELKISEINSHLSGDESIEYSIDTSQIGSSEHKWLEVTTLAVSTTPIVRTKMAFLYASPVENSLINNHLSRLLTPIPITSKRGYNYVEFAQPLYRKISVRNFMDISFEIIDLHRNKVNFQLYGDDLAKDENGIPIREYPTILNLHIRRAI